MKIEVCLSPELIGQHELKGKLVIVADIFRATSCIVTGFANGLTAMKPSEGLDETLALRNQGYLTAGERNGLRINGFDMGNSPFEYQKECLKGKKVAITTTNGTQALARSKTADEVLVGAFLNLETVVQYLLRSKKDVIVHCAGWKGSVNLEDSLFAGALVDKCLKAAKPRGDAALMARQLFVTSQDDLLGIARRSGHANRLTSFGMAKDLEFCMKLNEYAVLPKLVGEELRI